MLWYASALIMSYLHLIHLEQPRKGNYVLAYIQLLDLVMPGFQHNFNLLSPNF